MTRSKVIFVIVQIIGFVWIFAGGIWYGVTSNPLSSPTPSVLPTVTITPTPLPITGQVEYDIVAISDSEPPMVILIESVETESSFWAIAYFHDGQTWGEANLVKSNLIISSPNNLNQFNLQIESNFVINQKNIRLSVPLIYTSMVIRAKDDFSKFGGSTRDFMPYLSIENTPTNVRVGLLKGYNRNPTPTDVYDLGITTDWLMFWDQAGNFYHLDKTSTQKTDPSYLSHEFYAIESFNVPSDLTGLIKYPTLSSVDRTENQLIVTSNSNQLIISIAAKFDRPAWQDLTWGNLVTDGNGGYGVYLSFTPLSK